MMNYSDYDSDGYSSNEDADYVPSDDNLSEDDINECEKEDPLDENDGVPHADDVTKKKAKKRKGKDISMRKRKKGGLKMDEKDGGGAEEEKEEQQPYEELETVERTSKKAGDEEVKQKKKSDDLWASFLSDVGSKPKAPIPAPQSSSTQKADSSVSKVSLPCAETKEPQPAKVTITKVFDFAGEEVRVTKEVSADSREAKGYLKSQNTKEEEQAEEEESSSSPNPLLPGPRYTTIHAHRN
uniref:craniofacial development protein 1 n=1 Tax=Centroberyx gerrardi TaxID=166262 RepID=UPI003AAA4C5C